MAPADIKGYIHSFQSLGAVDGPGLRCVVFLQGCPLRCAYCHNPDTWAFGGTDGARDAQLMTTGAVLQKILRLRPYIKNGGVTVSGGEALMQPDFVFALFSLLKKEEIHTALDTSGIGDPQAAEKVLSVTDLVLGDLKFSEPENYLRYCRTDMAQVLRFYDLTARLQVPLWIRHVVVPGLNDTPSQIREIARIACGFPNLEKIELLPFRKICETKYEQLNIPFPLKDYPECSEEKIRQLKALLPEHLLS